MPKQNHRIEVLFKKVFYAFPPPLPHCYRGDVPQGMNIKDALKEVLRNALIHNGLARGLREAVKALDKYVLYTTLMGGVHLVSHAPQRMTCMYTCILYTGARLSCAFWQRTALKLVTLG